MTLRLGNDSATTFATADIREGPHTPSRTTPERSSRGDACLLDAPALRRESTPGRKRFVLPIDLGGAGLLA